LSDSLDIHDLSSNLRVHPIYPCLALQIYLQINELVDSDNMEQEQHHLTSQQNVDPIRDALFNSFQLSATVSFKTYITMVQYLYNTALYFIRLKIIHQIKEFYAQLKLTHS
jgi:hypothetical protein